jgi:hypothetical protein
MEELLRIETKYSFDQYKEFNYFHTFKKSRLIIIILIVYCLFFLLLAIGSLSIGDYYGMIFPIVAGAIMPLLFYALIKKNLYKMRKSDSIMDKTMNITRIFDEYIEETNDMTTTKIAWENIHEIYETKKYFYVYMNKIQVMIIPKDCFVLGTYEEFRKLSIKKIPKKFKIK